MRNIYSLLTVLLVAIVNPSFGQYTSVSGGGDFDADATWDGGTAPVDGLLNSTWTINGTVDRTGSVNATSAGTVEDVLNVSGDFTASQRVNINGDLNVGGSYVRSGGASDILNVGSTLTVQSDFTTSQGYAVNDGATLTIYGDYSTTGSAVNIYSGGTVEIYGSYSSNGNSITVHDGGTLIVHENMSVVSGTPTFDGNIVVVGSFSSGSNTVAIGSTGNLVVGQDLITTNHINVDGDNTDNVYVLNGSVTTPGYGDIYENGVGGISDFLTNEASNTALNAIVESLELISVKTWYLKNSGNWNVATNWTQDPAAAVTTPSGGGIPADNDNVVIPSGKTVTVPDSETLTLGSVSVYGNLDLATSSGHSFSELSGNGRLLLASEDYPTITDPSDFITEGEGEGTVVFYGNDFSLTSSLTLYNVEVDMTSGQTLTLENDFTFNGVLTIKTGTLSIGDASSRTLTVDKDITVDSGAILNTSGSATHNISCSGNILNNGTIDFDTTTEGVLTLSGSSNNTFSCNNTTTLNQLIINKGTDQTYSLTLSSNSSSNLNINGDISGADQSSKALYIQNGILKLSGNISLSSLSSANGYTIGSTAQLWLASSGVSLTTFSSTTQTLTIDGKLRITEGTLNTEALSLSSEGILSVEGGSLNANSITGTSSIFYQSGGAIGILSGGLDLSNTDNTYTATGGTLTVTEGDFVIGCSEGNYSVSGGAVVLNGTSDNLNTTSNLYDLTIGGSYSLVQSLSVSNDISITGSLDAAGYDLSIGGDFTQSGTYTTGANSTIFNGSGSSTVTGTVAFSSLELDKDERALEVILSSSSISVTDSIAIPKGTLNISTSSISVENNVDIKDGDVTGSYALVLDGGDAQYLRGSVIYNPNFGMIEQDNSNGVTTLTDITMNNFSLTNGVLHIGTNRLTVNANYIDGTGFSDTKMIEIDADHGSRGLKFLMDDDYAGGKTITFPVGTNGLWTYCDVDVDGSVGTISDAYLTVTPINLTHPTATPGAGCDILDLYWDVTESGLSSITSGVSYTFNNPLGSPGSSSNEVYFFNGATEWGDTNDKASGVLTYESGDLNGFKSGVFTAGKSSCFNTVSTISSAQSGEWDVSSTWVGNKVPSDHDYVVIKNGHTVTASTSADDAGKVTVEEGGILDIGTVTGLTYNIVEGSGTIRIASATIPSADFDDFMNDDIAIFEYYDGAAGYTLPNSLSVYPNLLISGTDTKTLPTNTDVLVRKTLTVDGDGTLRSSNGNDLFIQEDLTVINGGLFEINNGASHEVTVYGSIDLSGAGTNELKVLDGSGTTDVCKIFVYDDILITATSVIDLWSDINKSVEVHFIGSGDSEINSASGASLDFSRIVIDKASTSNTVTFNEDFDLLGVTTGVSKALDLETGICYLNNSGIDVVLTSDDNDFKIPSTSTLKVDSGATVRASGDGGGIWLDGALIIDNAGKVYCNQTTNNYIEYTASGAASIWLGDNAELIVGSQIRRSASSEEGYLQFTQTMASSNVIIGEDNAPVNNRGVFEILNAGSSFVQSVTGCNITIVRPQDSPSVAALYFDPESNVSIASGAGFTLGDGSLSGAASMGVYGGQELMNLTINDANLTAQLSLVALTLNGDLDIQAGAFDANNLNVTVNGNLANEGTFTSGTNVTTFSGSSDQTISGTGTYNFNDVVLNSGNSLTTSVELTVNNDLTITSGTLNTGTNVVNVEGDLVNNGTTLTTSGDGIILNNTSGSQGISGSGSYQNLTIDNTDGVVMPSQSSALTITGILKLEDGIFDIGRNLMEITNNAVFDAGNTYSGDFTSDNMIQTNLSFTDAGINKTFNSDELGSFIYPVGSFGLYTPVTINVVANGNSTGSIRVKAANEPHITIASEDLDQVLQYNWTLDADGITGFQGEISMQADASDEVGDASDYIGVRFELGGTHVSLYEDADSYDESNHLLNIDFNDTGVFLTDADIDGDYTAGESDVTYDVQAFISVADGNWTDGATWDYYDPETETTSDNGSAFPNGAIVYVADGTTVTMSNDERVAYATYIQETGTLDVGTTQNHRLGTVTGTGTLSVESGSLPAGVYTNFVSSSGGTLEYAGTFSESILSETSVVNNLTFTGTGTRSLPNYPTEGVTIYGDLTIDGPTLEAYSGQDLQIKGDVIFTSGSFDANSANVIINGSSLQDISGSTDFTSAGGGDFYNFEIDNASGVTVSNDIEISNVLNLKNGVVFTDAGGSLNVTNSLSAAVTGGSSSAYVQGPLSKVISDGDSFTFPMGDQSRYLPLVVTTDGLDGSPETWEVQYYSHNPNDDDLYVTSMTGDVAYVSHGEYWRVLGPDTETAKVTLNWDDLSGVNPGDSDFRVVTWTDLATDAWAEVDIDTPPTGTTSSGSVQTYDYETFNSFAEGSYYTFGSISIPAYSWEGDDATSPTDWFTAANWSGGVVPSASSQVTIGTANPAVIDGTASVYSLSVSGDCSLTLSAGSQLTAMGDISISDGTDPAIDEFVVQSSVASPTSIITYGSVSGDGDATYEWTGLTNMYWWHIGLPVLGVANSEFDTSYSSNTDYALNRYDAGWERVAGISEVEADYDFDADLLEGYALLVRYAAQTLSYSGVLNNDPSYSQDYSQAEWYLVANPYPSYIDVEDAGFDIGNFLKTVFIDGYDNTISTYNILTNVGVNGGTRYVAPGQAMWLRTYEASDAISIANTTRVHSTGSLKATTVDDDNIFRFTLEGSNNTDESVVLISNEFGSEFVSRFDSEKMMNGGNMVNVYSLKESKDISINALPEITTEQIVPLGYEVSEAGMGDFTFKASNINGFMQDVNVYLVDKVEEVTVNLRETPSYTFTASSTESNDRFELIFEASVTTGIDEDTKVVSDKNVMIYAVKQEATVKVTEQVLQLNDRIIEVYDVSGQLVKQVDLDDVETIFTLPQANMMYIINVIAGTNSHQEKVVTQE